jgi:GT2 family glycosyltransferase
MNSPAPQVSIVVNSFNPKGDARIRTMTEFALRCYRAFTTTPHELTLVDGHADPDPKLAAVCDELGYRYLNLGRRLSFAEGYNTGLRSAETPWVVIAANDIFVVAGWLEALLAAAKSSGAWMTAPFLSSSDYPAQRWSYVMSRRTFSPNFITFNLNLLSRHCVETVGWIDERFSGCFNDVDYALRIRANGGDIAICDCGEITHLGSATLTRSGALAMYERDYPLFEAKWPGVWDSNAIRLRGDARWLRLLQKLGRLVPSRWLRQYRENIYRIEPFVAPKRISEVRPR